MEKEKKSEDILKEIAKRNGWDIKTAENIYPTNALNRMQGHKSVIIINNHTVKGAYFISYYDYKEMHKYRTYSGVFFPVNGNDNYKLLIRKRHSLDKLNFRKNRLRFKIGNSSFDSKVFIETNNDIQTHKLLSNSKIQYEIIEYLQSADLLFIGINEINPGFTKDLVGKNFLSVFMSMTWMLDKKMIDAAFKIGELLYSKFNQNK